MPPRPRRQLPIADPDELLAALKQLSDRERSLLKLRYGLDGQRLHNLHEIGKLLGVSRERARQLEGRAIEKLAAFAGVPLGDRDASPPRPAHQADARSRNDLVQRWTLILLGLRPAHVYELRKRFTEMGIPPVSYRNLYRLEAEGLVSSDWAPASHGGPNRRIYTLTQAGRTRLNAGRPLLENTAQTLNDFLARCDHDDDGSRSPTADETPRAT